MGEDNLAIFSQMEKLRGYFRPTYPLYVYPRKGSRKLLHKAISQNTSNI